ncbi:hypothetical protein [Amycolatopsis japonica]
MSYQAPTSPIPHHLAFGLGLGAGATGLIALVLVILAAVLDWPVAPVTATAILAAFLGASSLILWCAERVIAHQTACLEANRAASRAEVAGAKKLLKERLAAWQRTIDEREAMRMAKAFTPEQTPRLHAVEEPHGMG